MNCGMVHVAQIGDDEQDEIDKHSVSGLRVMTAAGHRTDFCHSAASVVARRRKELMKAGRDNDAGVWAFLQVLVSKVRPDMSSC